MKKTLVKVRVAFAVSLLSRLTTIPFWGAGFANFTVYRTLSPGLTEIVAGIRMSMPAITLMAAVASVRPAKLARTVVVPRATPVTGTRTVVAAAGMVAVAGTVAVAADEELRLIVRPPVGAGPDKVRVRFLVSVPFSVSVAGVKLIVAVTFTDAAPCV